MSRTGSDRKGRRWAAIAAAIVAVLAIGVLAGDRWLAHRARPDAVGPRLVESLLARHPGTTIDAWRAGYLRAALPDGTYVDVHLRPAFDACEARPLGCDDAVEGALHDVDETLAIARDPRAAALAAVVVAEATPGFRYGFVTEPLVQPLEVRYALVAGLASTFVTSAIADRLGMTRAALRGAALARLRADRDVTLDAVRSGGSGATVFRVRSAGDAVASLLDPERMRGFAARLGTRRLHLATPSRGVLYLTSAGDAPATTALRTLLARTPGAIASEGDVGLLAYDVDAAGAALSTAVEAPHGADAGADGPR